MNLYLPIALGCNRWEEQVPDQRHQCAEQPGQRFLPVRPAQCQQPPLSHHAGIYQNIKLSCQTFSNLVLKLRNYLCTCFRLQKPFLDD